MQQRQKHLQGATWLTELASLVAARKQARWQLAHCAGEHNAMWSNVVQIIDHRIEMKERQVGEALGLVAFRVKREV